MSQRFTMLLRRRLRRSQMNQKQLLQALEKIGMRPGRGLGQNFLTDKNLLDSIVRIADIKPTDRILEAGPGFGALTELMLAAGAKVWSIEFDHRLAEYLRKNLINENFTLIEDDAVRTNLMGLMGNEPFISVANLPYSISSIFVTRLLEMPNPPQKMVFMLQKEMAMRLAATPGVKNYGSLSVRTQLLYDVRIAKIVPPEVFTPPPEVDSAIAVFDLKKERPAPEVARLLNGLVKVAFAQRRKQLGKVLGNNYGKDITAAAFAEIGIPHEIRPEKLTVDQFVQLTCAMFKDKI